jgi:hypothetical protein
VGLRTLKKTQYAAVCYQKRSKQNKSHELTKKSSQNHSKFVLFLFLFKNNKFKVGRNWTQISGDEKLCATYLDGARTSVLSIMRTARCQGALVGHFARICQFALKQD